MKNLDEKTQKKIIAIISALIPEAKIYLFGSRARGTNSEWADIDIALDAGKPLAVSDVYEISSMFKESNIKYNIDVVDLYQVSDLMRNEILKDKVIWKK
ncbi:MAG: nucleotidyltransferase domain-containing protein [Candidatus Dependentiae bacterium]|nr:nucleotidyltransferase domain-containing protein [Candidatus Dependentiae bacterium]